MTEIILLLIVNSFLCLGFYQACLYRKINEQFVNGSQIVHSTSFDKGLLWFIPRYLNNSKWWIRKPLYDCLACMASIHSYPYWIIVKWNMESLMFFPVYVLALSGINFLMDQITNKLD